MLSFVKDELRRSNVWLPDETTRLPDELPNKAGGECPTKCRNSTPSKRSPTSSDPGKYLYCMCYATRSRSSPSKSFGHVSPRRSRPVDVSVGVVFTPAPTAAALDFITSSKPLAVSL